MKVIEMPGPIPKRSDQRRRSNKPDIPIVTTSTGGGFIPRPEADTEWHPIAQLWFGSLGSSGQSAFYEPSDWAHAVLCAELMSRLLHGERISAQLVTAIDSLSARLLVTEGDRRRARVELERRKISDVDEEASVASLEGWRRRLGG